MKRLDTELQGLLLFRLDRYEDSRGFFSESYHRDRYRDFGLDVDFVQDNHSYSHQGVIRGLHYQVLHPQGKLVSVSVGTVFDVAVDLRPGSPTFGRWEGFTLDAREPLQLYIPPGFAHGFCVTSPSAHFHYKCTDIYFPAGEGGIRYDDPDLRIAWPTDSPIVSDKDLTLPLLCEARSEQLPR